MIITVSELLIVLSVIILFIVILIYYIKQSHISSSHKFLLHSNANSVLSFIENTDSYASWWKKFSKIYIYKTKIKVIKTSDNNQVKVNLYIHSNTAKEIWNIFITSNNEKTIEISVFRDYKPLSKLNRIIYSTLKYQSDVLNFKKDLIKVLK